MMMRNAFEFRNPAEEDPDADQLAMLQSADDVKDDEKEEEDVLVGAEAGGTTEEENVDDGTADPSDDLDKDGLEELEEMEKLLRAEENPILDFATAEEE
ncbi:MAG TPA: hypothetical protein VN397_05150 [Candidatus Methylomirabilis sp.]|nr:hypothetical protein [Candidatus Methylomirabilis sp.]